LAVDRSRRGPVTANRAAARDETRRRWLLAAMKVLGANGAWDVCRARDGRGYGAPGMHVRLPRASKLGYARLDHRARRGGGHELLLCYDPAVPRSRFWGRRLLPPEPVLHGAGSDHRQGTLARAIRALRQSCFSEWRGVPAPRTISASSRGDRWWPGAAASVCSNTASWRADRATRHKPRMETVR
jgi:hypothetical protein